ncbi:MAG: AAA family ATPase, partial [Methanomassiliicoccaceae archaeon]|nr:AAA family ATPase [Methanomassiliicoccaceae archaeon]
MFEETRDNSANRYRHRVIDKRISELLRIFGGVYITGPKWCGKSWTGIHHSKSALFVGDKDSAALAELDPKLALEGERPRLIDEWQDVPKLWDVARRLIDLEAEKGMFIFTGSVTPPKKATLHTGTGRLAKVRMRTMSLFESGDSSGAISLSDLFSGKKFVNTRSDLNYTRTVHLICRGGWPVILD